MNPIFIGPLADIIKGAINRIFPDPQAQSDAAYKLAALVQSGELAALAGDTALATAQIGVNNTEAASDSVFKGGWRPFVGWVCGSALAWNFIARPAVVTVAALYGHPVALPSAEMGELMPVLMGMLGLGAMRTVEKLRGAA